MSPATRAVATVTGDPALKLVLLCVAAHPAGWPAAADVAAAAELSPEATRAALEQLHHRRLIIAQTGTGPTRYGLPDEDGWTLGREPEEIPAAAAPVPPTITGVRFTGRRNNMRTLR